ncbi:hypothetical protein ACQV2C_07825 [Pantoea allii]
MMKLNIGQELYARLLALANEKDMSIKSLIILAIKTYLENHNK